MLRSQPYPNDVAQLLTAMYEKVDVVRVSPETQAVVLVSDGCPIPLTMVRDGASWKVDADPLIRHATANETGEGGEP